MHRQHARRRLPPFSCEQFVNMWLDLDPSGFQPSYAITSTMTDPDDFTATDPPGVYPGLIIIEDNAANRLTARVASWYTDHWALRDNSNSGKFVSKEGPGDINKHIIQHGADLECAGFSDDIKNLYAYIGDQIVVTNAQNFNCSNNTVTEEASQSFNVAVQMPVNTVEYRWESSSPFLTFGSITASSTSVFVNPLASNNTTVTLTLKARGVNTGNSYQTVKVLNVLIINENDCPYIDGTYTYSSGFGQTTNPLSTYNTTTAYSTSINITTCPNNTITWTQTSSQGSFFFTNNGHTGTVFLNQGECISFLAQSGSTSRNFVFCRNSGGWKMAEGAEQEIKVYPNPVTDVLFVDQGEREESQAFLFDLRGKIIKTFELQSSVTKLSVAGLSQGIYLLKVGDQVSRVHLK